MPTSASPRTSFRPGAVAILATALLSAVCVAALPHGTASAANGSRLESDTVYRLDPATPALEVTSTYSMTNTKPDRQVSGGTEYYFFTGIVVPIASNPSQLAVQVNDRDADYEITVEDGFELLDITFRSNLRYQQTNTIVVSYLLLGDDPRSDSGVRVNDAYATFPVTAFADDGLADVTIEIPGGWTVEYRGDDLRLEKADGSSTYSATGIEFPDDFYVFFTARRDDRLLSTTASAGSAEFEILAWPDDAAWAEFVGDRVTRGVPILERLTGTPWPKTDTTTIAESFAPYLDGYGGYYYGGENLIEITEELESHLILHELSHAWFNQGRISDRWLSEGLAEEVAARTVELLGEPLPEPEFEELEDIDIEPFPLNSWGAVGDGYDDAEVYGYVTSFAVLRQLVDEIGTDRLADMLAAMFSRQRAYPSEDRGATTGVPTDWRRFLDLAEQIGGSQQLERLYREFVVTDAEALQLDERSDQLAEYRKLAERGGDWAPPERVRSDMADWRFDLADDDIVAAHRLLDTRDDLLDTIRQLGLTTSPQVEAAYEDEPRSLARVGQLLTNQLDAAGRLVEFRADLGRVLEDLGLDVPELSQRDYDDAPVAIASGTADLVQDAIRLRSTNDELTEALGSFDGSVPPLEADAFVTDRVDALQELEQRRDTARALASAYRARDEAGSLIERVGAIGGDGGAELDEARAALAAGDLKLARSATQRATTKIEGLESAGKLRLSLVGAVLLAAVVLIWIKGRRKRRPLEADIAFAVTEVGAVVDSDPPDRDDGLDTLVPHHPDSNDRPTVRPPVDEAVVDAPPDS